MIARRPNATVKLAEALASTSAQAERDRQLAAWCGQADDEVGPFLARLALFDARTPAWEARQTADQLERQLARVAELQDTREGMLIRIDAVIADLVDQLGGPVEPWPGPRGRGGASP